MIVNQQASGFYITNTTFIKLNIFVFFSIPSETHITPKAATLLQRLPIFSFIHYRRTSIPLLSRPVQASFYSPPSVP